MFLVFLIKNICLMAFYFSYATIILIQPVHKSMIGVYFMILACCSLSYVLRFSKKYSKFKYLPVLGILGAILYLGTITGAIAVIFPFVYMFLFIKKNEYYVDNYYFKELFIKLIIAILVLMLFVLMIGKLELFKSISLQYVITFIISGLYLLRTTRHSKDIITSKKFNLMNILIIIVTFFICIVLSSNKFLSTLIYAVKFIYGKIISLLLKILYAILWPIMKIMLMSDVEKQEAEIVKENIKQVVEIEEKSIIEQVNNNETFALILYIFGIILLIFICAVLIKRYLIKQNRRTDDEIEGIRQYKSFLEDDIKAKKNGKQIFNNSINQIRYWYRKYLVLCYKRNMDIVTSDSSQSIHVKSCEMFVNSTQELENIKEIYRKARYSKEVINNQDVKKIKSIYKNLESDKNSKDK